MGSVASATDARPPSEASMLVTGTITLNGDGSVRAYMVDRPERLPASVTSVIQATLPGWKFLPPEGHPDGATGKMTLRLLARAIDDQHDRVSIGGASFYDNPTDTAWHVTAKTREPPHYPSLAVRIRESGTVYLLLRIGRDGKVQEVFAEQMNLGAYASPAEMSSLRRLFADAAADAAKRWAFNLPTQGKTADFPFWYVRSPIVFFLTPWGETARDNYGQWQAYVPGPRLQAPWATPRKSSTVLPSDAMVAGSLQEADGRLQLQSALGGE